MSSGQGNISHTTYNTTIIVHPGPDLRETNDWQENLVSILQRVPSRADSLKPLIQFLVMAISPAKIYMLQQERERDKLPYTDLLIVIPGKAGISFTELEPILEIAYLKNQKVSCSLHDEGNVLEGLRKGHVFYSLNFIPENLVYDDGSVKYPFVSTELLRTMKQQALEKFTECHDKANDFYRCALLLRENRSTPLTLFMLHQAAELLFRGILISLNGYDKKTHEIRVLRKHIRRCAQPLNECLPDATDSDKRPLDILEAAYRRARYENNYTTEERDIIYLFEKIEQLLCCSKEYVHTQLVR